MRVLFVGDLHGNSTFLSKILTKAADLDCTRIIQVGDFGYWEHTSDGKNYLDNSSAAAQNVGIPIYFCRGNHDNSSLLLTRHTEQDSEGFIKVRDGLLFAPDGHRWNWHGTRFAAFGGAYSVDKFQRLELERKHSRRIAKRNSYCSPENQRSVDTSGTRWFPEEQMSDDDMIGYLTNTSPVDIIIAHDKPRSSNPKLAIKDILECKPNQDRLDMALKVLKPKFFIHGHLHYRYTDYYLHDDCSETIIEGLASEPNGWQYGWGKYRDSLAYLALDLSGWPVL